MIKIVGSRNKTNEYLAAKKLGELICAAWPEVGTNNNNRDEVYIIPAAKAYGEKRRDIDLLVFGSFENEYTYSLPENQGKDLVIRNICLTIEIKSHSRDFKIIGNKLFVLYNGDFKDASEQSENQKYAVVNIFEKFGMRAPYVINLIWLTNFEGSLESGQTANPHNILTLSDTWFGFIEKVIRTNASWLESENLLLQSFKKPEDFRSAVLMFTDSREMCKPENYSVNFSPLIESAFDIFSEIGECPAPEIPTKRNEFVKRMHDQFVFFSPLLWDALNKPSENQKIYDSRNPFFVHKAKDSHLAKLNPCYWVCATNSADENYVEHVQLTVHIGLAPWYALNGSTDMDKHLAVKLAFFHEFEIERLDAVKSRIEKESDMFKNLIKELHDEDPQYVFYRTFKSEKDDEVLSLDEILGPYWDVIVEDILGYQNNRPVPRSTEFAKRFEWSDAVAQRVGKKKEFIKFLKEEFDKLLPLYNFYTQ